MRDEPLTLADLNLPGYGLAALAERIAPHLGPEWRAYAYPDAISVMLSNEDGLTLRLHYLHTDEGHQVSVSWTAPDGSALVPIPMPLFALPSQLATRIATEALPAYRRSLARHRDAQARKQALQRAHRGHAAAIADRLGDEWIVVDGVYGPRAVRPMRRSRVHGAVSWTHEGRIDLALHNVPPELAERIVAALEDHMALHESGRHPKRPKRLSHLLELMVAAGYRIDELHREHEPLFGHPTFKMDLGTVPGMPLLPFLFERPHLIDRAIRVLESENHDH